ncbi:hypothetical protein FHS36_005037 [Streptomyces eurocidicus]|uniref:Uncharacterized protein n=1 Tax=Streptomyces eurocidicus TaxID=66423 RepID=A0A7W8BET4_STREU|nr:hypothetical protein [Streptomyces eurocidicus]
MRDLSRRITLWARAHFGFRTERGAAPTPDGVPVPRLVIGAHGINMTYGTGEAR